MSRCMLCPRECGVDRTSAAGYCGALALPNIARAALHMWEEPYISGTHGSGTIFMCGCNLDCVFCQNHAINHSMVGEPADAARLCDIMLRLQELGAHNINLVTPGAHIDVIISAVYRARAEGLHVPIVYNTNAYEKVDTLRRLEGIVDIYLPDLKYASTAAAQRCSGAADYFEFARPAVLEMQRQCGTLMLRDGLAVRGVLVRHLVLPGYVDETRRVLDFLNDEMPPGTYISLMGQYYPCHRAVKPPLDRRLTRREYDRAVEYSCYLGFENVLIQQLDSALEEYTPVFDGVCE